MAEAVPRYSVGVLDDGNRETVQLQVSLPGVADSSEILFTIETERQLRVHVPGRYLADIPLGVPVQDKAERVQFLKKKALLKATMLVAQPAVSSAPAAGGAAGAQPARAGSPPAQDQAAGRHPQQQHADAAAAPASAPSPKPAAVPTQQQQQQQQQQPPRQQQQPQPKPAQPPPPRHQQQQPQRAEMAAPPAAATDATAAAAAAAASPREQLDADMYAAARQHSNREAAQDCHLKAQQAQRAGDWARAVRLLQKACQLDPGSPAYAAALQEAQARAAEASAASSSASSSGSSGASGSGSAPAAPQGASASSSQQQQQQQQGAQQRSATSTKAQRRRDEEARKQQQRHRDSEARAAEAFAEAAFFHGGDRKAWERARRVSSWRSGLMMLACLCAMLAALYGVYRLAPAGAPPAEAAAAGWRAAAARWSAPLLFLPRALLWRPTWAVAALWMLAGGAACLMMHFGVCFVGLYRQAGSCSWDDVAPGVKDMYGAILLAAWHPLLWWACGGGWGAMLGTLCEMFTGAVFGTAVYGTVMGYPLLCLALRLLGSWLLPYWRLPAAPLLWLLHSWRSAAAPLLWLPRHAMWQPTWWLTGALTGACYLAAERADKLRGSARRRAIQPETWVQFMMLVVVWWLANGGWWALAHTALVASGLAVGKLLIRLPGWVCLVCDHFYLGPLALLASRPLLGVLSICQCDMWSALVGIVAAVVLYLCINQLPQQLPGARQQQHQAAGGAAAGAGAGSTAHLHNAVPAGAPEAVARILQAGDYYEVLGLKSEEVDEAAVRRARRTLSLATHPDKIGEAPGGATAFNLVTEAAEILGDEASRRQYDAEMQQASLRNFAFSPEDMEGMGIPPEFADRMGEFMEAMDRGDIPQSCNVCGGMHFLRRTDRLVQAARQCDECRTRHPAKPNEVWFESSSAGFRRRQIHMFCCYKGVVYDMSEAAACEGTLKMVNDRNVPFNSHLNFFRGFSLSTGGGKGRQAAPPRQQGPKSCGGKKRGKRR